jgi:hypothetical protein
MQATILALCLCLLPLAAAAVECAPSSSGSALWLLPGRLLVLFLVKVEQGPPVCLAQPPAQFLVGLAAACALLSLSAPDQIEMPPEELLPWTGNV